MGKVTFEGAEDNVVGQTYSTARGPVMRSEKSEVARVSFEKGKGADRHRHPEEQTFYLVKGRLQVTLGEGETAETYVVEAGLPIFPEFASGPFGWRVGHLMSPADRRRYRLVAPADLEEFLSAVKPEAMLTDAPQVGQLDGLLGQAALQLGFQQEVLSDILVLWTR